MNKYSFMLLPLMLAYTLAGGVWADDVPTPVPATVAQLPASMVNAKDGAEMVLIPAGIFLMGTSEAALSAWLKSHRGDTRDDYAAELPQRKVELDAYYIYKNAVTVAQYRAFCKATKRSMPPDPDWGWHNEQPMVYVNWNDAEAYAKWAGASLPTEAQWEKAARGTDGRIYPWGKAWDATKCSNATGGGNPLGKPSVVGSFPDGVSATGCFDMAGNVFQWCADWYAEHYYKNAPANNPTGPATGDFHVLRGGAWNYDDPGFFRCAFRLGMAPGFRSKAFGFRCVVIPAAQ